MCNSCNRVVDTVDLAVQYMAVPGGGRLYSDGYGSLALVVRVELGGGYVLDPDPSTERDNYGVSLYLSEDPNLNPNLDLRVSKPTV